MLGHRSDVSLSVLVDILLDYFRKLISELRMKDYNNEGWQAWYTRSGSGQLLRQTSSAVCILNEIIYGLSDQSVSFYSQLFRNAGSEVENTHGMQFAYDNNRYCRFTSDGSAWRVRKGKDVLDHVVHCIGSILHEYLSPEVWNLPAYQNSVFLEQEAEMQLSLHFFRDVTMLHQVIIFTIFKPLSVYILEHYLLFFKKNYTAMHRQY